MYTYLEFLTDSILNCTKDFYSRSSHFCNMRKLILDSHEKKEAKCNKVTVTAIKIWTHTCTCNSDVRITGWRECSHQYFADTNLHEI